MTMRSLSEKPIPFHPHNFEFKSVREVPDTHTWSRAGDHPSADPDGHDAVPVIDLTRRDAAQLIGRACETWGVFQVIEHGVPAALLDRVESQARRLFGLPTEHKLRAARPADGVSGYGLAKISSFFSKLMWSEGFTIAGSPVDHARKLWPDDYSQFCAVIEEYNKELKKLVSIVMQLMLQSLGLTEEDLNWAEVASVLHMNSYPACPDPDRAMGLAAHTDSCLLTILLQSNTTGLQVLRAEDRHGPARWVAVGPLAGALVVNVGDLAHIISNGRFRSVVHRAVVNRTCHRISVAYICGPPGQVKVSPVERIASRPVYRAVTWAEYLGLKSKLFDRALASIRVHDETWEDLNNATSVVSCVDGLLS